ncbi:YheU family protein [Geotalea toluenoxydans]|uniref:YheU family protein n=1 Tax=Geotalea toluenoxydans TaxID=421624 RepID=UPI0006D00A1A|nr:YheU family protein [Geotalea toluenoxydans]
MEEHEVMIEYDVPNDQQEDGVEIPMDRIDPETLRNLIGEFVTREWADLGDARFTLDDKIRQVLKQLQDKKAKVVFDLKSNSANIVVSR